MKTKFIIAILVIWNVILTGFLIKFSREDKTSALSEKTEFAYDYILDELRMFERGQVRMNQLTSKRLNQLEKKDQSEDLSQFQPKWLDQP